MIKVYQKVLFQECGHAFLKFITIWIKTTLFLNQKVANNEANEAYGDFMGVVMGEYMQMHTMLCSPKSQVNNTSAGGFLGLIIMLTQKKNTLLSLCKATPST